MGQHKGAIDLDLAKMAETDGLDVIAGKSERNERTLCGRVEISPRGVPEWDWTPFYPGGTIHAKVIDGKLADRLAFWAEIGHHGSDFLAEPFLKDHPDYDWMRGLLRDMKNGPWSRFETRMKSP
jgi:hypothetical protein